MARAWLQNSCSESEDRIAYIEQQKNGAHAWEHGKCKAVWEIVSPCKAIWEPELEVVCLCEASDHKVTDHMGSDQTHCGQTLRRGRQLQVRVPNRFAGTDYFPNSFEPSMLPCAHAVFALLI